MPFFAICTPGTSTEPFDLPINTSPLCLIVIALKSEEAPTATASSIGDEPFQFFSKFENIFVAVDSNRQNGIAELQRQINPDIILLDDAFQHRSVRASINILLTPFNDLYRGERIQLPMKFDQQKIAINICYEDVFGNEIIRQLPNANILLNMSNDAWYGHSIAAEQHLQISQARAIETGRMMLRATNTGVTAFINEKGKVSYGRGVYTYGWNDVIHYKVPKQIPRKPTRRYHKLSRIYPNVIKKCPNV